MRVGVLGGTFDPIHLGHVAAARAAQTALRLDRIVLVPSRIPPHRPGATPAAAQHRSAMANLVAADYPEWTVSEIELKRDGPSYTYDTLSELTRYGPDGSQFFFITGADAFAEIATWYRYPDVLNLANFVIVSRTGITLDSLRERLPDLADRMTKPEYASPAAVGHRPSEKTSLILLETATPDVSSTEVRRRVRAGQSIAGLVPPVVAEYVSEHHLYSGK